MENINLNQLKYFFDAATEQSVAKAARINFVSQPAISQAIRKLGESLDVNLLVHGKNRFKLTENGILVFKKCQEIFTKINDMHNELKASQREFTGSLRFATSQSIALTLLPEKLRVFQNQYPNIVPKFKLGRTSLNRQWLEEGIIELVVTVDDGAFHGFEKHVLHSGNFLAIELQTTPKSETPYGFMIGGTYRPEAVGLSRFYEKKYRRPLPITFEIESWEVITKFVFKGLGIGLVPDFIVNRQSKADQKRLHCLAIPDLKYEVCAFFKKREMLSKNAALFLSVLTK